MSRPNAAQLRVLSFLSLAPTGRLVELAQLEQTQRLRPGDDLFVPSLVAHGWAEVRPEPRCSVRITDAGRSALADVGSDKAGKWPGERKA